MLPLPVVGGRFEDEVVVVPSMGERAPEYGAPVPGHAAGCGWIALWWAARLAVRETRAMRAKRCVLEGPLGGLPVSEPGVCCDTGLLCMGVDVARLTELLRDWARRV
jgi:hypothetical protein